MEERKAIANDIMIGNWFIGYDDKPFQWSLEHFELLGKGIDIDEILKEPIKVSEEMLLKCGAKKIEDEHVYLMLNDASTHLILMKSGEYWYPSIEQTPEFSVLDSNIIYLERIDSVHELQNLYKALTKTDLNF